MIIYYGSTALAIANVSHYGILVENMVTMIRCCIGKYFSVKCYNYMNCFLYNCKYMNYLFKKNAF